jgi:hypothetical protein
MFEGLLERVLAEYFGEWVVDLNREKLRVGVFSGEVVLRNLRLRKVPGERGGVWEGGEGDWGANG